MLDYILIYVIAIVVFVFIKLVTEEEKQALMDAFMGYFSLGMIALTLSQYVQWLLG
jgi:Mn2+/Fe2+ NRAMP family transporter